MKKKGDIWMPLYITDYFGDTTHLTTAQHGAYLLLLMSCWKGSAVLPDDDVKLSQIVRCDLKTWRAIRPVIAEFFDIEDGIWTQKRLTAEYVKAGGIVDKRRQAGKVGAAKRWGKPDGADDGGGGGKPIASAMANAMANGSQTASQTDAPSPSPTPKADGAEGEGKDRPEGYAPPDPHEPFAMHPDWQPSPHFPSLAKKSGLVAPDPDALAATTGEFIAYWLTQPLRKRSQNEWDHALVRSLKSDRIRSADSATGAPNAASPRPARPLTATERGIAVVAALTGRDRGADPPAIDGTAERVG